MSDCTAIQNQISGLFSVKLKIDVPTVHIDLIETGILDSMKFVELLVELEAQFGMKISTDDLEVDSFRSIARIAEFLVIQSKVQRTA